MSAPDTFKAFCHDWFPLELLSNLRTMLDCSGTIFYGLEVLRFLGTIPSASTPVLNIAVPLRFNGSFASFLCLNGYVSDGFGECFFLLRCCFVITLSDSPACLPARPIAQLYKNFMHFWQQKTDTFGCIHTFCHVYCLACLFRVLKSSGRWDW